MPLPLTTERLLIRPKREGDAEAMQRVFGDPQAVRWIGRDGVASTLEQTRERLAVHMTHQRERGLSLWAVELRDGGEVVGDCGLQPLEDGPEIELSYRLARAHWGHGYASEAARACLDYGLGEPCLERIVAIAWAQNIGSWRVMEKAGMRWLGMADHYGVHCAKYEVTQASFRSEAAAS